MKKKSHGQEARFRAVVQDEDRHALAGLFRVVQGDTARLARKFRHSFMLNLPPGNYRIEVQVRGYKSDSYKCTLRPKQGMTHYFMLKKHEFIDVTGRGRGPATEAPAHNSAATDPDDLPPEHPSESAAVSEADVIEDAEIIED